MKINTQRGIAPIIIILVVVALAGGGTYAVKKNADKKAEKVKMEQETRVEVTATSSMSTTGTSTGKTLQIMLSEQNGSGQSGKAVITEVNGKAKVVLNLTGKPSEVAQPAHIHLSTCAAIGSVKYPLTSISKGASQTMLPVSINELIAQLPISINVHKSAAEVSAYVACGDMSTPTKKNVTATSSIKVKADVKIR